MDRHLRERASQAADATPFKVIVTLKPGAKRHFVKAMKAAGLKVDADFTLTEAFAAQLPAGLLRALENDPDVEAISTDAPVTASGITSSVSGTPLGGPYTLRATLGLDAFIDVAASAGRRERDEGVEPLLVAHGGAGTNRLLLVTRRTRTTASRSTR